MKRVYPLVLVFILFISTSLNAKTLEGHFKIRSLSKDSLQLVQSLKSANVPQILYAKYYMVLVMLGYPHYHGILDDGKVTHFLFRTEDNKIHNVFLAKLANNAPILSSLRTLRWAHRKEGEWSLIAKKPEHLEGLPDLEQLKTLASSAPSSAFECHYTPSSTHETSDVIFNILQSLGNVSIYANLESNAVALNVSSENPPSKPIRPILKKFLPNIKFELQGLIGSNRNGLLRINQSQWPLLAQTLVGTEQNNRPR